MSERLLLPFSLFLVFLLPPSSFSISDAALAVMKWWNGCIGRETRADGLMECELQAFGSLAWCGRCFLLVGEEERRARTAGLPLQSASVCGGASFSISITDSIPAHLLLVAV